MLNIFLCKILYKLPNGFFPWVIEFYLKFFTFHTEKNKNGILFINTHDQSGGASKVAYQLASSQQAKRSTFFLVHFKRRNENWIHALKTNENVFTSVFSNYLNDKEKAGSWLDFSKISFIAQRVKSFVLTSKIVHLHNLHGGYFSYALLPVLSRRKRVIWTLHDEQALTGHCSFTMQCQGWKNHCSNCPSLHVYPSIQEDNAQNLLKFKTRWIKQSKIIYITPSQWLADRVLEVYPFLKNKVSVIPNGVDTRVFQPKKNAREYFGLPQDKFLILFIAEFSTDNPFKGGETFRGIVQNASNQNYKFITVGGVSNYSSEVLIELPYVVNEEELAFLYSACDLMVYPTNADNHPLVVLEAMACGLPVLAPSIGGIPEIIETNKDGWIVPAYSRYETYLEAIDPIYQLYMNENETFSSVKKHARNKIIQNFKLEQMLARYEKLYQI